MSVCDLQAPELHVTSLVIMLDECLEPLAEMKSFYMWPCGYDNWQPLVLNRGKSPYVYVKVRKTKKYMHLRLLTVYSRIDDVIRNNY